MNKYELEYGLLFKRKFKKLEKSGRISLKLFGNITKLLQVDPFNPTLKTHKVNSNKFGKAWSSKLDADLRLIWNFEDENKIKIFIADIGGHSGFKRVY